MNFLPTPSRLAALAATLLMLLASSSALAAGLLKPLGSGPDGALSIRSHRVDVCINNGFARTEVDQVFSNTSGSPVEGIYSFPLPKQASLSELSLWIGEKEILGEVVEKARAKAVYEQQKAQGNQTALAEKNDYKSFDLSVGNIPAGGETRVRLVYYQPMDIDLNVGRYLYPLAEGNVDDARLAFWGSDARVSGPFSFNLQLKSAHPLRDVRVPGLEQAAQVQRTPVSGGEMVEVRIEKQQGAELKSDIVFYYRLDDSVPARVELIPFKSSPAAEGTFMLVTTPAADAAPLSQGSDWTFVLDTSGSMGGNKIATLAEGVARTLGQLNPADRFRIISFNARACDLTRGYVSATPEAVRQWIGAVKNIQAGGGTNLYAGLAMAYSQLDADRTSAVVLVTDGVANLGETAHQAFLRLIKTCDIRLFTLVIGNSANQPLLERLARDSNGFALNISESDDIAGRLIQAKAKVLHHALQDVQIRISGEQVRDLSPAQSGSLYAGQQLVQFGRYSGEGDVEITLSARVAGQPRQWSTRAHLPAVAQDNPELERLWALSRIEVLMEEIREKGETEALRRKVMDLGLNWSLVTDYTSMLVVTSDVLENEGIASPNADRVAQEREAARRRADAPVSSHRVDTQANGGSGAFNGRSAPGPRSSSGGGGPVSLLTFPLLLWLSRGRKK